MWWNAVLRDVREAHVGVLPDRARRRLHLAGQHLRAGRAASARRVPGRRARSLRAQGRRRGAARATRSTGAMDSGLLPAHCLTALAAF